MIAIPNMEKPRSCFECPMQFGGMCYVAPSEIESTIAETVQELREMGGKPNWCPLIEIVECKDCKWFINEGSVTICDTHEQYIEPTDFCSYGERRADEHTD